MREVNSILVAIVTCRVFLLGQSKEQAEMPSALCLEPSLHANLIKRCFEFNCLHLLFCWALKAFVQPANKLDGEQQIA